MSKFFLLSVFESIMFLLFSKVLQQVPQVYIHVYIYVDRKEKLRGREAWDCFLCRRNTAQAVN